MSHKLSKEEIEEQFEQFLKESVSDESVDLENSPKSNVLGSLGKHTRKEIKKDANPWWINDNDSDEEQPPLRRFSKLKRQPAVIDAGVKAMVKEIGDVCVGNALCQSPVSQEDVLGVNRSFLKSQRFSQSIAEIEEEQNQKERERTSVSISQDSLEPNDSTMASGPRQSTPGVGLDTLEEEEEKEKFFANLEKGASSTIDYSKLNKELESTDSIPLATLNQNENRLQVLEIEGTKEEDESRPKSITASKCYSDDFDDYSDAKFGSEDFGLDDNILKTECIPETVETVKETKEQETEPGMLAKVVLLDSLDSTPDTQKLLQSEDDRSMIKPTTEEKYGQQDQASQMYTTNISYGQTNSDIEALHQAYCDIDQSLEATDAVQSIKNGNIINSVQDLQSPVKDSTRNISTGESDLFTIEELMKPIKAGVLVPRGYDSHPVSKNAQQHCEATETFRRTMAKDTYSAVPSELQLDSNHLSGRQSTYIELSEKLLKENESCMSRICEEDMEALLDEVKYDPTVKHSVSASQNVPHQDDQLHSLEANRKKLIFGGPLDPVTEEKLKLIEKEVQEQETLIQGYHQENERLYSQVKELQVLKKRNEEKMFTETQHLMAEIHRLKKHSHKDNMKQVSVHDVQLTEQVKDQNITDLLSQLRVKQKEETKYIEEIKKLKQEKQALMVDVEKMSKECNVAKMQLTYTSGDKEFEMKIMEEQYKQEIQRLNKRLQWYAENQEMLDKDASRLKAANLEIEKLKEQVEKLTAYSRDKNSPPEKRAKARALEAKRIQDLERQIKEMEEIIRRRYPNSLPALIYAAASVPEADSETEGRLHSRAFLEKRIKKLEADLEGKDEEAKKSLRVMEQQFQKIKIQYEQRVSDLEQCLVDKLIHERENLDDSDPKMKILEEEIFKLKEAHKSKENRLRSDIEKLKNQLYQTELKLMEREESSLRMADQHKQHSYQHAKIEKLNLELATKNREIQELSKTLEHLQRERRVLLNNKSQAEKYTQQKLIKKSKKDNECTESFPATLDEKIYQPNDFSGSHISEVLKENDILKSNIERLSLEVEQQRAQLAQFENEARRAQGDIAEHVAALKAAHQQELEQILTQHALEHSSSKVAELTNKISAQEVMMKHLREQINELQKDREALSFTKLREDALQSQMAKLLEELREAKENHSPEMKHFLALERKIQKMEFKYAQREQEFQQLIQQARHSADAEQIQEVEKWKKLAQFKNHELENFRTELDSILDVLRELQRQGVVIPAPSSTRQTISTFTRQL
ncbi:centrosomal protein of 162 kDa isoform X5 [Chiloscyllium plagiosum]|uniref:centrosomal protein of 162 kDa isoform X5 n=1 Tax=Chiloscyllium plagiosum TaxID=36176 RepID=UPI001CB82108|nr:centrosomal protein of 162 kDa isoform X5 [Chiloscyllium plagiosum]